MSQNNSHLTPKVSFRYDTLDSTNAAAVAAIHGNEPPAHGDVFLTAAQTAGRGQGVNRWHSSPGVNLTLSLVIYPDHLTADRLFGLSQLVAIAIAATVDHFLDVEDANRIRVKWPNDVYVGDRKIAGILVQNGLRGSKVGWSVIGIGLNVGEIDFPPGLQHRATSLQLITGRPLFPDEVLPVLFQQLSTFYPFCFPGPPKDFSLNEEYHRLLYRKDLETDFVLTATGQQFTGIIRGVGKFGRLRVEQRVGREGLFSVGEISLG